MTSWVIGLKELAHPKMLNSVIIYPHVISNLYDFLFEIKDAKYIKTKSQQGPIMLF